MSPSFRSISLLISALGLMSVGLSGLTPEDKTGWADKPTPDQTTFFETKIRPVLAENCLSCHGKSSPQGGLSLGSKEGLRKGGESGAAVTPGDPEKSLLVKAIHQSGDLKMPPTGKKLTPEQIADIEAWIKAGAPWPDDAGTKPAPEPLWSLQPVRNPAPPKVKNKLWVRNSIDAFVLAKLEAKGLAPAAAADRRTLFRRVSYDLIGLPPTPEAMTAFLADKSPDAYEKVVDRLLSSPQYGERQARHWLDIARYADTKGYVFNEDRNYYSAYTYRDWVIHAFNEDLPYDRFVTEQLAADRLPEVQNSDDKRPLAALGFLTLGRRFLNDVPAIIDDRIDVTMRGLQGFTVACARCHDHKFDPIPTQDYYSLYAVFNSSREVMEPISDKSIRDPWKAHNDQVVAAETAIKTLALAQIKRLRENNPTPTVKGILQSLAVDAVPDRLTLMGLKQSFEPAEAERLTRLQADLDELKKNTPASPEFAMAMADSPHPGDGVVFKRGNPGNPGAAAPRRFLLALSKPGEERAHWTDGSGRLELAKSIASRDNPLTARVYVNRVWQDHFGAGIVRTPSDFGHQGERPTDPALLDFLASRFMDDGWSIKKLHRLIVTSSTYRQSSDYSHKAFDADPDNRLWGRMNRRRLDLEEMRDAFMAASGSLETSPVGGKSVDLWAKPFSRRRAVYGFIERQNLPGVFRTFDFASPDSTSARRFVTTVPQQALFFMNSPFSVDEAQLLTSRPEIVGAKDDGQRVRRLYLDLFDRLPDADETAAGLAYLKQGAKEEVPMPTSPWQYGYGGFEAAKGRVTSFTPLAHYGENGYRVGGKFPDPVLGYLVLSANGGHPGHDGAHSVIRRWVAPANVTILADGVIRHGQTEGDGVRARIVSSRTGLVGEWFVHHGEAKTTTASITVNRGDTLDFVVDPMANDGFDSFQWAPTIRTADGAQTWDAAANFSAPPPPPLTRLTLYAQALMMTNEFMFVD